MRWLKRAGLIVAVLGLLGAGWALYLYSIAGEFRSLEPHFEGSCHRLAGVVGAEDITITPDGALAYISSDDRRAVLAGKAGQGALYGLSLGAARAQPYLLTPRPPRDFHPHGIGLWSEAGRPDRLFVVSHPGAARRLAGLDDDEGPLHTIEVFERNGDEMVQLRSLSDPLLVSPNDVVPVGPEQFYVTNDHGSAGLLGQKLEDYLHLAAGDVIYFDGSGFREVASDLYYANGINTSADRSLVYVACTTGREIVTYERDAASGDLQERSRTPLDAAPDNIELDEAGALWVGAHPKLLTFVAHAADPAQRAPSEVLELNPDGSGGFGVEEIFLSLGEDLSASSVAARRGQRLLIGAVFDPLLLDCTMK